jgi:hypothetical protein
MAAFSPYIYSPHSAVNCRPAVFRRSGSGIDSRRHFSAGSERDHSGSERKPGVLARTPNERSSNSRSLRLPVHRSYQAALARTLRSKGAHRGTGRRFRPASTALLCVPEVGAWRVTSLCRQPQEEGIRPREYHAGLLAKRTAQQANCDIVGADCWDAPCRK